MSFRFKFLLLLSDLVCLLFIFAFVYTLRFQLLAEDFWRSPGLWFIALVTLSFIYIFGGYDVDEDYRFHNMVFRVAMAVLVGILATLFVHYFFAKSRIGLFSRLTFLGSFMAFLFLSLSYRVLIVWRYRHVMRKLKWLFIVSKDQMRSILPDLKRHSFHGEVYFLLDEVEGVEGLGEARVLGSWQNIDEALEQDWAALVTSAQKTPPETQERLYQKLMKARFSGHHIMDLGVFYEIHWRKVPVFYLTQEWFVGADGFGLLSDRVSMKLKRLFDICLSLVGLILSLPFFLLSAVFIVLESPGGVFYRQIRTGRNGKDFTIYKLRSMRADAEKSGAVWASKNDTRVTRVGKFIRLTRIDELPQLFNVLKGDMSFVGPRPERPEFNTMLAEKIPFYNLRHMAPPGITGWAQVLYPYGASIEDSKEKLQYELYYIRHHSLVLDFLIILKTINVVIMGRGR